MWLGENRVAVHQLVNHKYVYIYIKIQGNAFLTLHCKTWLVKIRSENHVEKIKIPPQEHSNQGTPVLYYTFRKPGQTQGKLIGIDGPL